MMFDPKAHIIIVDGQSNTNRDTFCFELALALLYNAQKTAFVLSADSPLREIIKKRHLLLPELLSPAIINKEDFYNEANKYSAVIIPQTNEISEFAVMASTFITLISKDKTTINKFIKRQDYLNKLFELKKKIAATYGRSLNWIVCENNLKKNITLEPSPELLKISRLHGFRVSPPLNDRQSYKNDSTGISAQDKSLPMFNKELTYEDICTKREIIKLAEFIFS